MSQRPEHQPRPFLTAEWRDVAMLNYEIDPGVVAKLVPAGTELDQWQGRHFLSLVGFHFLKTKVLGVSIPFHSSFEEVNLRFYVRREVRGEMRRGVAFVREIVPRWAVSTVARLAYNEPYVTRRMAHHIEHTEASPRVEYRWAGRLDCGKLSVSIVGEPLLPSEGSQEQFISEHFWGYTAQHGGGCREYRVDHPPWRLWRAGDAAFAGDVADLYGPTFASILKAQPVSAFVAEGSAVTVFRGKNLTADER